MTLEDQHGRRWGPRFNLGLLIGAAILCAIWTMRIGDVMVIPHALILYVFVVAVVLTLEALVLRLRGQVPALPSALARLEPHLLRVTIPLVLIVTLLREGVLAPHFTLDLNWWQATHYGNSSSSGGASFVGYGDPLTFAGHPVVCTLSCTGAEPVCEGIDELITCDEREASPDAVSLQVDVRADTPFCYVPLVKSGDGNFSASASVSLATSQGSKTGSVTIDGAAGAEVMGLMSCRSYRQLYGREIGKRLVAELDGFLAQN